jgi:hypothetical protein
MALNISAIETSLTYDFTVMDDTNEENTFVYSWGKEPNEGQTKEEYIQQCKNEALLLAQHEIDRKAEPTTLDI